MDGVVGYVISLLLGGGLLKAIESVYRAVVETREKQTLAASVGAKTPSEIESVSVATMTTALESAENRIKSLEKERTSDREYYLSQIAELKEQLKRVHNEMQTMERKLGELLAETTPDERKGG